MEKLKVRKIEEGKKKKPWKLLSPSFYNITVVYVLAKREEESLERTGKRYLKGLSPFCFSSFLSFSHYRVVRVVFLRRASARALIPSSEMLFH